MVNAGRYSAGKECPLLLPKQSAEDMMPGGACRRNGEYANTKRTPVCLHEGHRQQPCRMGGAPTVLQRPVSGQLYPLLPATYRPSRFQERPEYFHALHTIAVRHRRTPTGPAAPSRSTCWLLFEKLLLIANAGVM